VQLKFGEIWKRIEEIVLVFGKWKTNGFVLVYSQNASVVNYLWPQR